MVEILLAIIAAELGFAVLLGVAIFALEFYSLYTRWQAMKDEAAVHKIRLTPEEMEGLLSGKGLPAIKGVPGKVDEVPSATGSGGHYL